MPRFGRKEQRHVPAPVEPDFDDDEAMGLTYLPNGDIRVRAATIPQARLAIKQLKLKKKEFAIEKKGVAAEMAQVRAVRRMEVARQGSKMRGGGGFGRFVRSMQTISRDTARARHAERLAPLEHQKAAIDARLLAIDSAIAQLEAWIIQAEIEGEPEPPPTRQLELAPDAQTITCPRCGTSDLPDTVRFCPNCGLERAPSQIVDRAVSGLTERHACPRCGAENRTGEWFCRSCGFQMRQ